LIGGRRCDHIASAVARLLKNSERAVGYVSETRSVIERRQISSIALGSATNAAIEGASDFARRVDATNIEPDPSQQPDRLVS
jgi:pyruvoyl-dependent arginine decarboxylase (PvlArgDC)